MTEYKSPNINTLSILSTVCGVLIVISFCSGVVPIPFTGFICFPTALMFSLLSVILGSVSLKQIRTNQQDGKALAWIGILIGGLTLLLFLCLVILLVLLFVFAPNSVPIPPFINNYQF